MIADHYRMGSIQHIHFVQDCLGPEFLQDTDDRIYDDYRKKGQISEGAYQAEKDRQNQEDQVKIGKNV